MTVYAALIIVFIHWFADFVCQTNKQAMGKSKAWEPLLSHTAMYSVVWFIVTMVLGCCLGESIVPLRMMWFAPITFLAHTATDYYTSRVNSVLATKEDKHDFFVSIGFDQFLHYAQLFITYDMLMKMN